MAALRMKAREHSEALLQSANLLGGVPGPGARVSVGLTQTTNAVGGEESSPASGSSKLPTQGTTPEKQLHCPKENPDKK